MNRNVKIAKELVRLAKSLTYIWEKDSDFIALDEAEKAGKKYILWRKDFRPLWRIRACKDFGNVKKGEVGGLVESEKNLSHEGNCWVTDDAKVFGNARVYGDAQVNGEAMVYGDAQVYGNALVTGGAHVYGNARVYGDAQVDGYDCSDVYGDAKVYGKAKVDYPVSTGDITE